MITTTTGEAHQYIRNAEAFRTRGALRGEAAGYLRTIGWMPPGVLAILDQDLAEGVDYIVYSYDTAIAWRLESGTWRVPAHNYSPTTATHQWQISAALEGMRGVDWACELEFTTA